MGRKKKTRHDAQLNLFDPSVQDELKSRARQRDLTDWPEASRFPINFDSLRVEQVVRQDLVDSSAPLIITGFTSLDYIIEFVAKLAEGTDSNPVRLLVGSEPAASRRSEYPLANRCLPQEVADYWLHEGFSVWLCHKVVLAMEMLRSGQLDTRFIPDQRRRLHGKIYCGDEAITMGSSNFSYNGMRLQLEANARFSSSKEPKRFHEATQLAENYWSLGDGYNDEFLKLLERLLRVCTWQEALGRACAELLEGDWAQKYINHHSPGFHTELWPSQKSGIAQAIWMVENVGAVLVADATGSGKTRMGAHLLRSVRDRLWRTGRAYHDMTVVVCPPGIVEESWKREALGCGMQLETISHGILSRSDSEKHDLLIGTIRRAQSLAMDEAHNFLNRLSARTRNVLGNMADVVVLFTATPINRGARDLLMLVDLLGADNLDDSALELFDRLAKRHRALGAKFSTTQTERVEMQKELQRFTLRRTKTMLNAMVDRAPEAYRDDKGRMCRYPAHRSDTYATEESSEDQKIAQRIRDLAGNLKGLVNLQSGIDIPKVLQGVVEEDAYVKGRLRGAQGLALYQVMSRLRSSKAALIEHLLGTQQATKEFGLSSHIKAEDTGAILQRLEELAGNVTQSSIAEILPSWLTDEAEHRKATKQEVQTYSEILELVRKISDARVDAKAKKLLSVARKHPLVIAFDSCLITLEVIRKRIQEGTDSLQVLVATGAKKTQRNAVNKAFALGSEESGVIALCSDAMSEGLNLQQGSAVVLLDMPSVIRIAEQRVGRIDRMDSPHEEIEVFWPKDSEAFSLRSDRRFFERHREVRDLIGSNLELPEDLIPEEISSTGPDTAEDMIAQLEEMEREGRVWDGLQDAFQPVRDFVDGDEALVPPGIYQQVRESQANVVSAISLLRSKRPWAFFAVAGAEHGAPRWVYFDSPSAKPISDLQAVAPMLREVLSGDVIEHELDERASQLIDEFSKRLLDTEVLLLPRKKQRALSEMKRTLTRYADKAEQAGDLDLSHELREIVDRAFNIPFEEETRPDLDGVAEAWLDLIRETWYEHLTNRKRIKPLRLKDLRRELDRNPIPISAIRSSLASVRSVTPIYKRVVVTIAGVPD